MEPFSITSSIVSLLCVCLKVGTELKKLRIKAKDVETTVTAMVVDINFLRTVLMSMESSFEEMDSGELPVPKNVTVHLTHVLRSLSDGSKSLANVERFVAAINLQVKTLDPTARYEQLRAAAKLLATYRQEVQAYRDTLQLSHDAIALFTQVNKAQDTKQMEAVHNDITQLATNLDIKLQGLETLFHVMDREPDLVTIIHLRDCVQSAAVVVADSVGGVASKGNAVEDKDYLTDFASGLGDALRFDREIEFSSSTPNNHSSVGKIPSDLPTPSSSLSVKREGTYATDTFKETLPMTLAPPSVSSGANLEAAAARQDDGLQVATPPFTTSSSSPVIEEEKQVVRSNLNRLQSDAWKAANETETTLALQDTMTKRRPFSMSGLFSRKPKEPNTRRLPKGAKDPRVLIQQPVRRKLVFVGDGACGKTSFLIRASYGSMPEVYVPTVFENYSHHFYFPNIDVEVDAGLWDTAGQEDYDRLRPLSYPDSHIFCICFSIDSPPSLDDVYEKWAPEIERFNMSNSPVYLLGFKKDLRDDTRTIGELIRLGWHPVTEAEAEKCKREIRAEAYFECSAKTGEGVKELLEGIFKSYFRIPDDFNPKAPKSKRRSIFGSRA